MNLDRLITDRTIEDVRRVQALKEKFLTIGLHAEELHEYMAGMKGAYNARDLNRVGAWLRHIAARMHQAASDIEEMVRRHGQPFDWASFFGIAHELDAVALGVYPKTNWNVQDIPRVREMSQFLENLSDIREQLHMPNATKVPDSLDGMTYETANDIERLIFEMSTRLEEVEHDIVDAFRRFVAGFVYTGAAYCGE